jgi:hypothetical protein
MSQSEMHKAVRAIDRRPAGLEAFRADPEQFLAEFDLTAREREALARVDPWELLELGVHPIFIRHITRHLQVPHAQIYTLERGQGWLRVSP